MHRRPVGGGRSRRRERLAAIGLATFRILRDFKKSTERELEHAERREAEYAAPVDNLSSLLVQNFRVLNSYYSENLAQARTSTRASISIAVLGFVAIVAGVLIGSAVAQDHARRDAYYRDQAARNNSSQHVTYQERCEVSHEYYEEERIDGYRVTYVFDGETYTTRMSRDPGEQIRVWVTVRPAE